MADTSLSSKVRELRKLHALSQSELAQIADVSLPSISRFECGKESIRLDVLVKILSALGHDLDITPKKR